MLIFLNLHNSEPEKAKMTTPLIEGLVMNLAMKIMVLQFMLKGPRPCTILFFNVHTPAEYLNGNVSIGQLLQHITKSIVVGARSRPKMLTKTENKDVC